MKVLINGQDYGAWLDASRPLSVVRKLNEPSVCALWMTLPADGSVAAPGRGQAVSVQGDDARCISRGMWRACRCRSSPGWLCKVRNIDFRYKRRAMRR